MAYPPLILRAGPEARRRLSQGWNWSLFDVLVGASAGPRWLVLGELDRVLIPLLKAAPRTYPIHLLGSSSGSWRFLPYCQRNPLESIGTLEDAYIEADWTHNRPLDVRGQTAIKILDAMAPDGYELEQEHFRLHVVTARCKGPLAWENYYLQFFGILLAAGLTAWNRSRLGWITTRELFSDIRNPLPARLQDIATRRWPLRNDNLRQVLLASGAIPLVLPGVRDVPGGPPGCLRDGGLVDYHFDQFQLDTGGLILYPHFHHRLQPSWLEHRHPRARVNPDVVDRMVVIHPDPRWIASLPTGTLPDRQDAFRYTEPERIRHWREVLGRSKELAQALESVIAAGDIQPLEL